jgi:hypothetical protein
MAISEERIRQGRSLEELAATDWPQAGPGIVASIGRHPLAEEDRAFFRSLRPRGLTALIIGIDR